MMQPRFAAVQAHIAITMLAVVALFALLDGRPVWPALFSFVPWFGLGLAVLEVVLLVRILLPSAIYASVAPVLSRVVMVAHVLVFALAGLGALVQLNARLDRSQPREYSTRVTALFGEDADLLETVWYSWARVDSWRRQNASERILLTGRERRALWGGQPILVRVGDGRFFIPWVIALEEDKETKSRDVLRAFPDAFVAWRDLIQFYAERQRWDAATAAVLDARRRYPGESVLATYAATRLSNAGRYEQVVVVLEPLSKGPVEAGVLRPLGLALAKTGRRDDGIRTLQRVIELEPDDYWAYNALAHVRMWGGERDEAIRLFEKVLLLQPGYPEAIAKLRELRGRGANSASTIRP